MPQPDAETTAQTKTSRNRWYVRVPLKLAIFSVVTFLVLFPSPSQFATHLDRLRHLERMIEPDAPQLAVWEADIRDKLEGEPATGQEAIPMAATGNAGAATEDVDAARRAQRLIQDLVSREVRYEWDWNLWGSADYIPTIEEMFWRASADPLGLREDCDGRAVLAASLMRRLGYEADLATDLRHVWVVTPEGEWMDPGVEKVYERAKDGYMVNWSAAILNMPGSVSFGVTVFPLGRELIILVAAYLLLLHRHMKATWAALAAMLLVQGLLFMRCGFLPSAGVESRVAQWPACVGLLHLAAGIGLMLLSSHRARRLALAPAAKSEASAQQKPRR